MPSLAWGYETVEIPAELVYPYLEDSETSLGGCSGGYIPAGEAVSASAWACYRSKIPDANWRSLS